MKNMNYDICTFGSITLDLFMMPEDIGVQDDYFHFPIGDKIKVSKISKFVGGGAANTGVGFSKMGLSVAAFGVIGDDDESHLIIKKLKDAKVETKYLTQEPGTDSSFSIILTAPSGGRTVFHHRTTGPSFGADTLRNAPTCQAVYISHLYEKSEGLLFEIPDWKKRCGGIIGWNPGKTQFSQGFEKYQSVFPSIDALILNVEEAELFTGIKSQKIPISEATPEHYGKKVSAESEFPIDYLMDVRQLGKKFLEAGVNAVVITDGKRGSQLFNQDGHHIWIPTVNEKPVSTLGAGDAFSVGFISALLYKKSPEQCMLWGSHNASSTVQEFGAQNGQLTVEEMELILKS